MAETPSSPCDALQDDPLRKAIEVALAKARKMAVRQARLTKTKLVTVRSSRSAKVVNPFAD